MDFWNFIIYFHHQLFEKRTRFGGRRMIEKKEFLATLFKTGEVTNEQLNKFLIQEYFLKGYTLSDFEDDLVLHHNQSLGYTNALIDACKTALTEYSSSPSTPWVAPACEELDYQVDELEL